MMEPLPVGAIVLYHGERHVITEHQKLGGLFTGAELDEIDRDYGGLATQYPDGVAYVLWREGVLRKFGNRAYSYYRVRRGSFTDTGEREAVKAPARTDSEWLYGDSPAGLRYQAAEELAAEFGTDVDEWLV